MRNVNNLALRSLTGRHKANTNSKVFSAIKANLFEDEEDSCPVISLFYTTCLSSEKEMGGFPRI